MGDEVRVPVYLSEMSYDTVNMMLTLRMTVSDAMRAAEAFRRAYSVELVFNVSEVREDGFVR